MEIPFQGQIDVSVLKRMNGLFFLPTRKHKIFLGLVAFFLVWGLVIAPLTHGGSLKGMFAPLAVVLIVVALLAYSLITGPRKVLKSGKLLQEPITGRVTETGVHLETPHSRSDFPWDVFFKARIGPDLVLLYHSIQVCNAFPREFFASDADWQSFVDLVRQRVTQHPRTTAQPIGFLKGLVLWLVIFLGTVLYWWFFKRPQ